MRIRHVLPQPAMGTLPRDPLNSAATGVVAAAWSLAVQQAADGHEVEMIAPGEKRLYDRIAGVKVCWLPQWARWHTSRYDLSYLVPLLLSTLRYETVDVTHVHSNPYFLTRLRSRARVMHFHNSPIKGSPRYDQALARAERVICCSRFIRQQLIEAVTYPPSRIEVVHNGVDRRPFQQIDRARARATFGIADEQIVLLYVGRIGPEKGLLVLIEALEKIVARGGPRPLLLIAGSGMLGYNGHKAAWPELRAYEQLVRQRASPLPARFLGDVARSDLPELYRAADVFVCPSVYQEPFGMVNVEAAAAGLPVVASAVGGIPEAVVHEQTGLLVPPSDAEALADALLLLVHDSALRGLLGRAAQDLSSQFEWQALATKVSAVYDSALRQAQDYRPL